MPSLMASIGLDTTPFKAGLDRSVESARTAGQKIMTTLGPGMSQSTVFNPRGAMGKEAEYSAWWSSQLALQGQNRTDAEVEAASRRNQARRLMRERAEARTAREAQAAEASVFNRATSMIGSHAMAFMSFAALEEGARHIIEYSDKVDDLSVRLGMSATEIQRWFHAVTQTGGSEEAVVRYFTILSTSRNKALAGNDKIIDSFKRLGVTIADLQNLRLEEVGAKMAEAFQTGDPQALVADLRAVGGRGAGELVTAFRIGLQDLLGEASVISDDVTEKLGKIPDRLKSLWEEVRAGAAPVLAWLGDIITEQWRRTQMLIEGVVGGTQALLAGRSPITGFMEGVGDYAKTLADKDAKEKERRERLKNIGKAGMGDEGEGEEFMSKKELAAKKKEEREHDAMVARFERDEEQFKKKEDREYKREQKADLRANAFKAPDVNALQRIGANLSPLEDSVQKNTAASAQSLQRIEEMLRTGQIKTSSRTAW